VIVRIANEAQYRLDDGHHAKLDELDDAVVAAVSAEDRDGFAERFTALLQFVRQEGQVLSDDDLDASVFILPPADLSFEEAGEGFNGEGLIPDPA
jgi:hypothetical protein